MTSEWQNIQIGSVISLQHPNGDVDYGIIIERVDPTGRWWSHLEAWEQDQFIAEDIHAWWCWWVNVGDHEGPVTYINLSDFMKYCTHVC